MIRKLVFFGFFMAAVAGLAGGQTNSGVLTCTPTSANNSPTALFSIDAHPGTFTCVTQSSALTPQAPNIITNSSDVLCEKATVVGSCAAMTVNTVTYFATPYVIPAASASNLIDGVHHALLFNGTFDAVSTSNNDWSGFGLAACSSLSGQTCNGAVVLWSSTGSVTPFGLGTGTFGGSSMNCTITVGSTATTLITGCTSRGWTYGGTTSSVVTGVPNTTANWVLVWFAKVNSNADAQAIIHVSDIGLYVP